MTKLNKTSRREEAMGLSTLDPASKRALREGSKKWHEQNPSLKQPDYSVGRTIDSKKKSNVEYPSD